MRTLEWLMVLLGVPAIAWALFVRRALPLWVRLLTFAALLLLPLHVWLEGAHWQMIPAYLTLILLAYLLFSNVSVTNCTRIGAAAAALTIGGLALCFTLPMFHLPRPTGPYPIATRTLYFVDPNRQESHPHAPHIPREVVVQIWYPSATTHGKRAVYREWKETDLRSTYQAVLQVDALQDAPFASGQFPVILFNHAWRGFRNRSTFIMQELASHGFVVVSVAHPWNAATVALHDGRIASGLDQIDLGDFYLRPTLTVQQRQDLGAYEMRIQTDDDKLVLDQLTLLNGSANSSQPSPFAGHLDLADVGAFGHSFGGEVSAELAKEDPRVLSAALLDADLSGPVAATGLEKPLLRIMAVPAPIPAGSENSPVLSTRVHAQMSLIGERATTQSFARYGGYQVVIEGIDHENFTDKGFFSPFRKLTGIGSIPQGIAANIIDSYLVAFFLQTLRHQPQPLLSGSSAPFPEVRRFQIWPPSHSSSSAPTPVPAASGL